jgi:hypothetical protein
LEPASKSSCFYWLKHEKCQPGAAGIERKTYDRIKDQKNTYDRTTRHPDSQISTSCAPGKAGQARGTVCSHGTGAGAVPTVQARLGSYRGENAERPRHAVCVPVLPAFAPRAGTGARIPKIAPRAMDQAPPR